MMTKHETGWTLDYAEKTLDHLCAKHRFVKRDLTVDVVWEKTGCHYRLATELPCDSADFLFHKRHIQDFVTMALCLEILNKPD